MSHGSSLFRHGIAQLTSMLYRVGDTTCCIARDENHFVALAVNLANNATWREEARQQLMDLRPHIFDSRAALHEWTSFLNTATASLRTSFNQPVEVRKGNQSHNRIHNILTNLKQHNHTNWIQSAHQVVMLAMELLGCREPARGLMWSAIAEEAYSHSCEMLMMADSDCVTEVSTVVQMANTFQEISGCFLWIYQSFETSDSYVKSSDGAMKGDWWNMTVDLVIESILVRSREKVKETMREQDMSALAAFSALFAHSSLALNPRLINAAAFGAAALTRIDAYDAAADLYVISAHLKRPYFGNMDSDKVPDWHALASLDPFDFSSKGPEDALMVHPSTAFDLGLDDGDADRKWRPFRRIQFGG